MPVWHKPHALPCYCAPSLLRKSFRASSKRRIPWRLDLIDDSEDSSTTHDKKYEKQQSSNPSDKASDNIRSHGGCRLRSTLWERGPSAIHHGSLSKWQELVPAIYDVKLYCQFCGWRYQRDRDLDNHQRIQRDKFYQKPDCGQWAHHHRADHGFKCECCFDQQYALFCCHSNKGCQWPRGKY